MSSMPTGPPRAGGGRRRLQCGPSGGPDARGAARVGPGRREADVGGLGPGPHEHGPVGHAGTAGRRPASRPAGRLPGPSPGTPTSAWCTARSRSGCPASGVAMPPRERTRGNQAYGLPAATSVNGARNRAMARRCRRRRAPPGRRPRSRTAGRSGPAAAARWPTRPAPRRGGRPRPRDRRGRMPGPPSGPGHGAARRPGGPGTSGWPRHRR